MGADVTVAVQAPVVVAVADAAAAAVDNSNGNNGGNSGVNNTAVGKTTMVLGDGKSSDEGTARGHEKGRNGGSAGAGAGGAGVGGVEVRLEDARAVIVRGERDGGVAEGGLRRVGFEIGEWVRGWEEREERAARRGS